MGPVDQLRQFETVLCGGYFFVPPLDLTRKPVELARTWVATTDIYDTFSPPSWMPPCLCGGVCYCRFG